MKKLITILFLFLSFSVLAQPAQNITIGKGKLAGMLYNTKSGAIDTIISLHPDSLGQFKFMNGADPVNSLDLVNYRTLLNVTTGLNLDSLMFDHAQYMNRSMYDADSIEEQLVGVAAYQTLVNKTLISPVVANFTNATHNHTTNATGGTLSTDNIIQGIVNLYSQWTKTGSNIYRNSNVGIGTSTPQTDLDVAGTTRTEIIEATSSIKLDGLTITDIVTGTGDNDKLTSKGYVDDAIAAGGGYTNEMAQDAVGTILDNDSIGDIDFIYNDGTPLISATVQDNSHAHTAATVSGLTTADFEDDSISQWNNDAGYVPATYPLTGDLGGTLNNPSVDDDSHSHTSTTLPATVVFTNNTQTITAEKTFSNITTKFGSTAIAAGIDLYADLYPVLRFHNFAAGGLNLARVNADLTWEYPSGNPKVIYHAGNSNLSTINWAANNITAAGTIQGTTAKLTNLNSTYLPYHISDGSGFGNTNIYWSSNILTYNGAQTFTSDRQIVDKGYVDASASASINSYIFLEGNVTDRNINVDLVNFVPTDKAMLTILGDADIEEGDTITISVNNGTAFDLFETTSYYDSLAINVMYLDSVWYLIGSTGEEYVVDGTNLGDQTIDTIYVENDTLKISLSGDNEAEKEISLTPYVNDVDTLFTTIAISDETTALDTGTVKRTFRMPIACTLVNVRASVTTAPTGSTLIFDINESGTSVLSTKLSIDATEKTSKTAASAAVISDSAIADDAEMTIDIDQKGSTVAGAGAKIILYYVKN